MIFYFSTNRWAGSQMDEAEFLTMAQRDIGSLLAASLDIIDCGYRHKISGGRHSDHTWISLPGSTGREIGVSRTKILTPWEKQILKPYGDALKELSAVSGWISEAARIEVAFPAMARLLGGSDAHARTIESSLRSLLDGAGSTYEGQPRNLNLLIDLKDLTEDHSLPHLSEVSSKPWYPVLGTGLNTGFLVDQYGRVHGLTELELAKPESGDNNAPRPYAFGAIGDWTTNPNRVALSLTRSNELLVHHGGQLRAIHRSRQWHGLPFEAIAMQAWSAGSRNLPPTKEGVLASIIDACLGHHGAAIGIVARGRLAEFKRTRSSRKSIFGPKTSRVEFSPT
jgi:hypothetical protein